MLEPLNLCYRVENEVVNMTSVSLRHGPVYRKVYNVADLVIPIPQSVKIEERPKQMAKKAEPVIADFDTLIETVTSTIAHDSWDESGGPGSIAAFETNLSLVVSQTENVHQQIAELLEQKMRNRNVQVSTELRIFRLPVEKVDELLPDGLSFRPEKLTDIETFFLFQAFKEIKQAKLVAPKVTTFDGQSLELSLNGDDEKNATFAFRAQVGCIG